MSAYINSEGSTKVEKNKLSFFKKIKISIFDFDGYQDLAAEKISKTIIYIVLLMLIFSIVISCIYVSQFYELINQAKNYINNNCCVNIMCWGVTSIYHCKFTR